MKVLDCRFQFYDSTIKSQRVEVEKMSLEHFNSTIVRLKAHLHSAIHVQRTFQFYDSTIKSVCGEEVSIKDNTFQFYDSTIKRYLKTLLARNLEYFNSTIVRLKDP